MGLAVLAARWLIAALFLRAALAKRADPADFRAAVANYRLLPGKAVPFVARAVPAAELAAALLLAVGLGTGIAAGAVAAMLLVFCVAIGTNLARGRVFDCGCAGFGAPKQISWRHVATNIVMAAAAVAVTVVRTPVAALWNGPTGPFRASDASGSDALPVALAVVLTLVVATLLRRAAHVRTLLEDAGTLGGASIESEAVLNGAETGSR